MAIRYRKEYKTWQVYWTNPITGKRESKSFASEAEAKKENSLVLHRLKYEQESFRRNEAPEQSVKTFEQVYVTYLREKQFSKKDLARHLTHMRPILKKIGVKPMTELDKEDYEAVKKDLLANTDLTAATVHKKLSLLRTIVYYAVERGLCEPVKFPRLPSPQYKSFVPPSPDEVAAIYQAASPHIQRVVVIGAYCGVRIGECELLSLTWDDIDFERKILRVHGSKKNPNAPWREVPIRESLMPLFSKWHKDDISTGNSYLIHFAGKSVTSIKNAWRATLKRAGITRHIRPYDLRHAFGTELVAAGVDVGTVAKLMGHSSPTMLLTHYQYVMDKQKRSAVEALPDTTSMCRSNVPQKKEVTKNSVTP